jgi:hypothetical protein
VGRYGADIAGALIAFAGVEPGMRCLDVGCGLRSRSTLGSMCGDDATATIAS